MKGAIPEILKDLGSLQELMTHQLPFAQPTTHPNINLENLSVFNIHQSYRAGQDAGHWIFNLRREIRNSGIIKEIPPDM